MKHLSYLLASLVTCSLVFGYWIGGWNVLLGTGLLNTISCSAIFMVGVGYFVSSYWRADLAWVGADNCISLGLLGTVVGLTLALPNVQDIETATTNIALALWTTGVGLVCSVILYNHGYFLGAEEEEHLQ